MLNKLLSKLLQAQQDRTQGPTVLLLPYSHGEPPNPELAAAWRVLRQELTAEGVRLSLDQQVEEPDADPLVLLRWPHPVLPGEPGHHLVLWSDRLWVCKEWRQLLGERQDQASFSKFSLPLVKKIYPQLLASKIIDVQPMTTPTALVAHLRSRNAPPRRRPQ
jgi:hypothetical protein